MVLYRKYRPQKFSAVIGQEHIKRTLVNSLVQKSFGHGYLFSGPRGSGKTTLARIFAKALNCTGRKIGKASYEPCNKCYSCKEINAGKSLDIIEIDAASNRGIDEIRELREKIRFAPTTSTYKVYIIDEVHMLTKEAFNALLKTLEEPPAHAIFIMATTEAHKVLPTILSRVQRFDFHKASVEELERLIKQVSQAEKIKIDQDAITLIAQMSFGAYRDALSLLDQTSSTSTGKVTLAQVQEILGLAQEVVIFDFLENLINQKTEKLVDLLEKLYFKGVDFENFTSDLIEVLRKIALLEVGQDQIFDLTKEQQAKVKELSEKITLSRTLSYISKFVTALSQIKNSSLPQLPLEMVVLEGADGLQTTNQYKSTKEDDSTGRRDAPELGRRSEPTEVEPPAGVERRLSGEQGIGVGGRAAKGTAFKRTEHPETNISKSFNKDLWPKVISEAKKHNNNLAAMLSDALVKETTSGTIILAFKFKFHANMVANKKNQVLLEEIIQKVSGNHYLVSCLADPGIEVDLPKGKDEEFIEEVGEVLGVEE